MKRPKLCKDWKNKVVCLNRTITTRGGEVFHIGEWLQVRSVNRKGEMELHRRARGFNTDINDCDFDMVGDADDIYRVKR